MSEKHTTDSSLLSEPMDPSSAGEALAADVAVSDEIVTPPGHAHAATLPPPDAIPGYHLLREIRATDRAVTYEAVHISSQRRVAIKVLNDDPLSAPDDRARFDRTIETLAHTEHPGIVSMLDSGVVAGARYFVSECVSGQSLRQYIAGGRRSVSTTLRVFSKICDAVASAHAEQIVHGNLRPANVLVDASGNAFVLDFGIPTAWTGIEAVGDDALAYISELLPFASPERVSGQPADTRSDVYSLGVILFQMLTGMLPWEETGQPGDVAERIRSEEPVHPAAIRAEVGNAVEAIVLKCLAKEPSLRYANASELGEAVQHCLRPESVRAGLDPYAGRNKEPRGRRVTGTITVALVVAATGLAALSYVASQRASAQGQQIEAQRQIAQRERDQALTAVASEHAERVTATRAREEAETARNAERQRREKAEAAAEEARQEAIKPTELVRALTEILMDAVNATTLEPVYRRTLEVQRRLLGEGHLDVAVTLNVLARVLRDHNNLSEAESSLRQSMRIFRDNGGQDSSIAQVVNNLATVMRERGELAAAEVLQRESLSAARKLTNDVLVGINLSNLAAILKRKAEYAAAESAARESLDILRDKLGEQNSDVSHVRRMLASILMAQKQYPEAETHLLNNYKNENGPDNQAGVRETINMLIKLYDATGQNPQAAEWRAKLRAAMRPSA